MTSVDTVHANHSRGASLGDSRARVLAVLQAATAPLSVERIAELVGLHPNTARFHLDGLIARGLARRANEERDTPGRPRSLYSARADGPVPGPRNYRLLAEILAGYLARSSDEPGEAAMAAGELWGRAMAGPTGDGPADAASATAELLRVLSAIGFAPEAIDADGESQVVVGHCPFREVAAVQPEVICGIHLGITRGVLAELGAPLHADRLDPHVEPNRCVTHLSRHG